MADSITYFDCNDKVVIVLAGVHYYKHMEKISL